MECRILHAGPEQAKLLTDHLFGMVPGQPGACRIHVTNRALVGNNDAFGGLNVGFCQALPTLSVAVSLTHAGSGRHWIPDETPPECLAWHAAADSAASPNTSRQASAGHSAPSRW